MSANNQQDEAKWKYEQALFLVQYGDRVLWSQYGTFLLAETILLGFIGNGVLQLQQHFHNVWLLGGAIFGLLLCLLWWIAFEHNYAYWLSYILRAKKLEPEDLQLLSQEVRSRVFGAWPSQGRRTALGLILVFAIAFLLIAGRTWVCR